MIDFIVNYLNEANLKNVKQAFRLFLQTRKSYLNKNYHKNNSKLPEVGNFRKL